MKKKETEAQQDITYRSAETYSIQTPADDKTFKDDVLVIDQNLKGLDFKLAKCCNPIYGDDVLVSLLSTEALKFTVPTAPMPKR